MTAATTAAANGTSRPARYPSSSAAGVPLADLYGMLRRGDFDLRLTDFPVHEDDLTRRTDAPRRGQGAGSRHRASPGRTGHGDA